MELKELLYKIAVEKQYEYIGEIMKMPQIWGLIWSKIKNYRYRKEEVKNIAEFLVKEAIIKEYHYEETDTEKQFIGFLKKRPLARIHREVSWQVFNIRTRRKNDSIEEVLVDPDDCVEMKYNDTFEQAEISLDLQEAIGKLTPIQQQVVRMLFFNQMTEKDVANQLGITQPYVNRIKKECLNSLKMLLK